MDSLLLPPHGPLSPSPNLGLQPRELLRVHTVYNAHDIGQHLKRMQVPGKFHQTCVHREYLMAMLITETSVLPAAETVPNKWTPAPRAGRANTDSHPLILHRPVPTAYSGKWLHTRRACKPKRKCCRRFRWGDQTLKPTHLAGPRGESLGTRVKLKLPVAADVVCTAKISRKNK